MSEELRCAKALATTVVAESSPSVTPASGLVARWPALSLREPWLTAVLDVGKCVENRRWNTNFRGRFWLHAAKGMTKDEFEDACDFIEFEAECKPPAREQLRFGGIAGAATLVSVIRPGAEPLDPPIGVNLAWWMREQYGFVLADVVRLPRVIPCRGSLGFFEVPPDVEADARVELCPAADGGRP